MADMPPQPRHPKFLDLSDEEANYLKTICAPAREHARHSTIRQQGDPVDAIFMLTSGWAASYVDLRDGQRQIVKVHLPTDLMGVPSMSLDVAAETLVALTTCLVSRISLSLFAQMFKAKPRLAAHLFLSSQQERVYLMDRLTSIGRLTSERRLAAFLVHMHDRLVATGGLPGRLNLPLTQVQIGDIIGLTPVHVNRVIQALESKNLIQRSGSMIQSVDVESLRQFAGLPHRNWTHEPAWARVLALDEVQSGRQCSASVAVRTKQADRVPDADVEPAS